MEAVKEHVMVSIGNCQWCERCGMVYYDNGVPGSRREWGFPKSFEGHIIVCAGGEVLVPPCSGPTKQKGKLSQL